VSAGTAERADGDFRQGVAEPERGLFRLTAFGLGQILVLARGLQFGD